jgi:hypothetical protein
MGGLGVGLNLRLGTGIGVVLNLRLGTGIGIGIGKLGWAASLSGSLRRAFGRLDYYPCTVLAAPADHVQACHC